MLKTETTAHAARNAGNAIRNTTMLDTLADFLADIAALAPAWKFLLVFLFMAIESSFVPFPSEVVMIPAGFWAMRGEFGFAGSAWAAVAAAFALGLAGALAGAYFNYWISLRFGEPFLRKYGKWFFLKPEALDRSEELFNKYGGATTFICRLVPVIRQLISIPAGLSRMPLGKFTLYTGLGAGIWNAVLVCAGAWIADSAGTELTYRELVHQGKDLVDENLPWVILGGVALAAAYVAAGKLAMGGKKGARE